jgi:hypothetical protein
MSNFIIDLPEPHPEYRSPREPARLEELKPWTPGEYGKFIGYPDGYVHVWANQPNTYWHDHPDQEMRRDGWPSHSEAATAIGRPLQYDDQFEIPGVTMGWISKEGEIEPLSRSPESNWREHIQSIIKQHPQTYLAPQNQEDEWHFGATLDDPYPATPDLNDTSWEDEFDQNLKDRMENPPPGLVIQDLVEAGHELGHEGKGLRLDDGTVLSWNVDDYGSPHHQDVMRVLGLHPDEVGMLHLDKQGNQWDEAELGGDDWGF